MFKAYSVQTIVAAINFVQDLKLGHYIKVPPRATFTGSLPSLLMQGNSPLNMEVEKKLTL